MVRKIIINIFVISPFYLLPKLCKPNVTDYLNILPKEGFYSSPPYPNDIKLKGYSFRF